MAADKEGQAEPVAIVGIGCRLPGGVRDIPSLWEFLRDQRDVQQEFTEPRFAAKAFYHPALERPGSVVASSGFLLDEDPRLFDPAFFGITDVEAESMDASQRKLLEVTYEAFENAGETWESVSNRRIGVFVGDISFDNYVSQTRDWDYSGKYSATGAFPNILANRLHYVFNLKGPSVVLNSACTSAMYALHLAILSMQNGDCETAIVAGSNWIMDPNCHLAMGKLGALSPTSRSHTFDASADGYARGEGFAAIYLTTASAAIRDGMPIRGMIMGSSVNANGREKGITNPSGPAQEAVIRAAYKNAGNLDPSLTALLECHGTGTRVGDPIEVMAAGNVFGPSRSSAFEDRLLIGSIKTNMGHLEGACTMPSILKVVAALEAGQVPPGSLHYKTANPRIDFEKAKARVVTSVEPWPKNKLKRASVTSAGFGGTNGHCVIDHVEEVLPNYIKPGVLGPVPQGQANGSSGVTNGGSRTNGVNGKHSVNGSTNGINGMNGSHGVQSHRPVLNAPGMIRKADVATRKLVILPFSAHNTNSLTANMIELSAVLGQHSLADVAYTLSAKRSRLVHKSYVIVDRDQVAQDGLGTQPPPPPLASSQQLGTVFVFTGQGAQWHAMGAQLLEYAVFRKAISYLDRILAVLPLGPAWKVADVLSGEGCDEKFVQTPVASQTLCTALQIGLVDLLASWSIRPAGVVGHSSGEMAAAYASGRITAAEAITMAYYRGYTVARNQLKGAMIAVGMGPDKATEVVQDAGLEDKVGVAAYNSPDSVTLSGDADAIELLAGRLSQAGVFNRLLRTGGLAYHSHHMLLLGQEYATVVEQGMHRLQEAFAENVLSASHKYPVVPWFSSVYPGKGGLSPEYVTASYWRSNLESPVRFTEAVSKLLTSDLMPPGLVAIEVGPHPALKSPLAQIAKALGKKVPHIGTVKRGEDGRRSLLELAGSLFAHNAHVDLVAVNAVDEGEGGLLAHGCMAVDLPSYRYTYGPVRYLEGRLSKEYRLRKVARHDLLGARVAGTTKLRPQWRNILRLKDLPWLDDHRVPPHVLHPGAAHIVMAMVAAEHAYADFPDALPITGLTLRNVSIKKALVVPEDDEGVEIVLSMELEDGATAKAPGWASFSIASLVRDSDQWTEHASGLVKVEVGGELGPFAPIQTAGMDARAVDAQSWYTRFADMGLAFGPSFQGYYDMEADPVKRIAVARLAMNTTAHMFPGGESRYPIHPCSLDLLVRLGLIACSGGQAENLSIQLPVHLDQMRFQYGRLSNNPGTFATGISQGEQRGLRGAYAQAQLVDETGHVILDVDNFRFASLLNEQEGSAGSTKAQAGRAYASPFARMVWRPDIRLLSKKQLRHVVAARRAGETPGSDGAPTDLDTLFGLLGHANPDLRILHLGAGGDHGALLAADVLKTLNTGPNGIKLYREYVLADVTQESLGSVAEALSSAGSRDVKQVVLDIGATKPWEEGSQPGTYDVIIWSTESPTTGTAIRNCAKLLPSGGRFLLAQPNSSDPTIWTDAGFDSGARLSGYLIATKLPDPEKEEELMSGQVVLLHSASAAPTLLRRLAEALKSRGTATKTAPFNQGPEVVPPGSRVVAFLEGEDLLTNGADQHRIGLFQHLAANTATMIWITSCGMVKGRHPDGAFVHGLLRTVGSENPAGRFLAIDVDADGFQVSETEVDELLRCVLEQQAALERSGSSGADDEVNRELTWQEGCMWTSRIVPDAALGPYADVPTAAHGSDEDQKLVPLSDIAGPVRAAFATPGLLTSLYFHPYTELWQPLPRDWIEVKVEAVGLNWKDLSLCTGRVDHNHLSNEYCGIITQTGSEVGALGLGLQVGDRVYGLGKGHFGNYTRVPALFAQKLRPEASVVEAATMPVVYMTAVYAFEHLVRLRPGQRVLIQSAAGGLGLACVRLAQYKGAEVFATVGSSDKARFLTEKMGIPASHCFSSRGAVDRPRMMHATQGRGFDVIVAVAQGDQLYESVKTLAPMGMLIDVGRVDVTSSKNMALELFQKSAGFLSFDLGLVVDSNPALGRELMQAVDAHWRAGHIGPIDPHTVMDISQLDQALLRLSKGTHIGKTVISYQDANAQLRMRPSAGIPATFDPEARYVLVGGLSALGRSMIRWMADRGARHLVVWSRRGAANLSSEAATLVRELADKGVHVQPVACDVGNRDQVLRSLEEAQASGALRGILNYAVEYHDISFDKMTEEQFRRGMAAKVLGTRHLHEATIALNLALDFFAMVGSFGTIYAFPTQSTYLASNNWLDYFARHRRAMGLPVSVVSLGYINDMGPLAKDPVTINLFARIKGQTVTGAQVLRMLEPAFVAKGSEQGQWLGNADDPLSAANIFTGVDPAVLAKMRSDEAKGAAKQSGGQVPRWYHDARVSIMLRGLDDAWRHQSDVAGGAGGGGEGREEDGQNASPTVQLRRQFKAAVGKLRATAEVGGGKQQGEVEVQTVAFVAEAINTMVAAMRFLDPSAVSATKSLAEQGIDSLLAAEFRSWLNSAFGKNISMLDLMGAKMSPSSLAQGIVSEAVGA
ncbi:polyketide synthase [Lasiosphaeria hispida]|uniref:Polyketide synthase n=1 Tax=Lasiosphaeria hispida TaxID=260671 RepID=A0AAJ0HN47_9PEZI|nr:polyketide synthase [Lasiosphaeria hispida]